MIGIVAPIMYYTNAFYTYHLPISSTHSFDNTGKSYDVNRILDGGTFNNTKYQAYSPLFLSATFTLSYGLSFAAITAVLTHTFLYNGKQIWNQSRKSMHEQSDIHARLMAKYPQVPEWWYAVIFCEWLMRYNLLASK